MCLRFYDSTPSQTTPVLTGVSSPSYRAFVHRERQVHGPGRRPLPTYSPVNRPVCPHLRPCKSPASRGRCRIGWESREVYAARVWVGSVREGKVDLQSYSAQVGTKGQMSPPSSPCLSPTSF